MADHLAILDQGVLRVHCPVDEFCERVGRWILRFGKGPREISEIDGIVHSRILEDEVQLTIANPTDETERLLAGTGAVSVERVSLSLDQAVIDYLTQRGRSGSLLQIVGAGTKPDAPIRDHEPSTASAESS